MTRFVYWKDVAKVSRREVKTKAFRLSGTPELTATDQGKLSLVSKRPAYLSNPRRRITAPSTHIFTPPETFLQATRKATT